MLQAAFERGWLEHERTMLESLLAIRRAGADFIVTYFAMQAARLIRESDDHETHVRLMWTETKTRLITMRSGRHSAGGAIRALFLMYTWARSVSLSFTSLEPPCIALFLRSPSCLSGWPRP